MREDEAIEALFNNAVFFGQIFSIFWIIASSLFFFSLRGRPASDLISYLIGVLICAKMLLNASI